MKTQTAVARTMPAGSAGWAGQIRRPSRRLFGNQVVQAVAVGIAVAWLSWPVETIVPYPGLEPSWRAGLSMAARQSLDFGDDVVFTYGPLGFLAQPYLYYPLSAALAGLYVGVLQFVTAASLFWAARASFGFLGAAVVAWATSKMAIGIVPTTLLLPALAFLWCTHAVRRSSHGWYVAIAVAGGAVGALELVTRTTTGVAILAISGLALVLERERRVRNLAIFGSSAVATLLTLWLASGQDFRALPDYGLYSFEILAGHTSAMGFEEPGRGWEYPVAAAVLAVVGYVGLRNTQGWSRSRRLKVLALGALLAYATFKQSFVRHDVFHAPAWFLTAAVVVVSLAWRRDRRAETTLALACVLVALIASAGLTADRLNPIRSAVRAADQLGTMLTSERLSVAAETRASMRQLYGIDEQMLALLRGRTVHVLAHETSVVWAYPELRWHPLPVFQSYIAYTKRLDRLNASALASDGPEFILRHPDTPIDGRHFTLEAPETMLAMFCRYRQVQATSSWQVLRRGQNRCGTPRKIGQVRTKVGDRFAVPAGSGRGLILVDLHGLPTSPWQRLRSLIFRPDELFVTVNESAEYRLVPETAKGRLLVRIPNGLDFQGGFALSVAASSLRIGDGGGLESELTVDFYEVPIARVPAR